MEWFFQNHEDLYWDLLKKKVGFQWDWVGFNDVFKEDVTHQQYEDGVIYHLVSCHSLQTGKSPFFQI